MKKKEQEIAVSDIKTNCKNEKNSRFAVPPNREDRSIHFKNSSPSKKGLNSVEKQINLKLLDDDIGDDTLERNIERELEGLRLLLEKNSPKKGLEKVDKIKQVEFVNRLSDPVSPIRSIVHVGPHKLQPKKNALKSNNKDLHRVKSGSVIPAPNAVILNLDRRKARSDSESSVQHKLLIVTPDIVPGEVADKGNISELKLSPNLHQESQLSSHRTSNKKTPRNTMAPPPLPVEREKAMLVARYKHAPLNDGLYNEKQIETRGSISKIGTHNHITEKINSRSPQIQPDKLKTIIENHPLKSRRSKALMDKREESTMSAPPSSSSRKDGIKSGSGNNVLNISMDGNVPLITHQQYNRGDVKNRKT